MPRLRCVREELKELKHELGFPKDFQMFHEQPEDTPERYKQRMSGIEDRIAKEAVDVVYTIVSMFVAAGWDFQGAFEEVHRSNMSKGEWVLVSDPDHPGHPIRKFRYGKDEKGKVLKPDTYSPANVTPFVKSLT